MFEANLCMPVGVPVRHFDVEGDVGDSPGRGVAGQAGQIDHMGAVYALIDLAENIDEGGFEAHAGELRQLGACRRTGRKGLTQCLGVGRKDLLAVMTYNDAEMMEVVLHCRARLSCIGAGGTCGDFNSSSEGAHVSRLVIMTG